MVTRLLLFANIALWIYALYLSRQPGAMEAFYDRYSFDWTTFTAALSGGNASVSTFVPLITHQFLHGGWLHVLGNMLYLWIFGDNVEDVLGHARFLLLYLLSGVAAAVAQSVVNPASGIPMVGASGAISGVLGAYLLQFPYARILTLITFGFFFRFVYIPAVFVLGFWIVVQFLNGLLTFSLAAGRETGGVAWFAHIGGFLGGMALLFVLRPRRPSRL